MKKVYNIITILLLIFIIYINRSSLNVLINEIKGSLLNANQELSKEDNGGLEEKEKVQTKEETPGALRVINSVLSNNENTELTHNGIVNWTNKNRNQNGVSRNLKSNTKLDKAAQKKVDDMFINQYFEHDSPSGVGVGDLGKEVGYEYILIGENLALGNFKNDEAIVEAWMNSPGHRANILNTKYTEIGVAVGEGMFEGKKVWLAVQHFGLPKDSCPGIDPSLKSTIDINQKEIDTMQASLNKMDKEIKLEKNEEIKAEKIKQYNVLVGKYNNLLNKVKSDISLYNAQVKEFNVCVEEATDK